MRLRLEPLETRILMSVTAAVDKGWQLASQDNGTSPEVPALTVSALQADPASMERYRLGFDEETIDGLVYHGDSLAEASPVKDATPIGKKVMLFDDLDGTWSDAEKSPTNYDDDLMCWAAAASNILDWTGWGDVSGMSNSDQMFDYFQDHWTDDAGLLGFAWDWWFDGTNYSQGWSGWSQVDVPGGGFFASKNFNNYYRCSFDAGATALSTVASYLHDGYGVGLGVYDDEGNGHAITCWGYNRNATCPSLYYGVWVSDSDDAKSATGAPDQLRYYEVTMNSGKWHLENFYGSDRWYIDTVEGLAPRPTAELRGTVINDANANARSDAREGGLANQRVYLDVNENFQWDHGTVHAESPKGSKAIEDFTVTTSSINITGAGSRLRDVNVTMKLKHTCDADLEIYLVSPAGTPTLLCSHVGGTGNNFSKTTFDDEATRSITQGSAPYKGAFRPDELLSTFDGENPNGAWTLVVIDCGRNDAGKLKSWSIDVTAEEPSVRSNGLGNFVFTEVPSGKYSVRYDTSDGWSYTVPRDGHYEKSVGAGSVVRGLNFFATPGIRVNFSIGALLTYGKAKGAATGTAHIFEDGAALYLNDDCSKAIDKRYTVTASTVLEFDFRSGRNGKMQAIGFDKNLKLDATHTFELCGMETYGIQAFRNYDVSTGDWQHFVIPVGRFYTGKMKYLFFVNSGADVGSEYANVHIYQRSAKATQAAAVSKPQQNVTYAAVAAGTLSRLMLDRAEPTAASRPSLAGALLLEAAPVRATDVVLSGLDDDLATLARIRSLSTDRSL